MKKLFLLLFVTLNLGFIQAQNYTIQNEETGANLNDGDMITINTNQFTTHLLITNNSTVPMKASLKAVNIINTDGSEMGFCFGFHGGGNCYFQMANGATYDSNANNNNYLMPGEVTESDWIDFTHNDSNPNFTNYPKDYILKLTIFNANDNSIIGSTTFTYRYDPSAGIVGELTQADFQLISLPGALKIQNTYPTNLQIFNLTGQSVLQTKLEKGNHSLSTGNLQKGIYIVHAQANGRETFQKIIIK